MGGVLKEQKKANRSGATKLSRKERHKRSMSKEKGPNLSEILKDTDVRHDINELLQKDEHQDEELEKLEARRASIIDDTHKFIHTVEIGQAVMEKTLRVVHKRERRHSIGEIMSETLQGMRKDEDADSYRGPTGKIIP